MKNKILSNIINYVIENNIQEVDNDDNSLFNTEYSMSELNSHIQWTDISESFRFDKVGVYLLENFQDAIEKQDFISAKYMKEEITKHWDISKEDIWEKGREFLYDLKIGSKKSSLNYLFTDIKNLEYTWINSKFEELEFINSELEIIQNNINNHTKNEISEEVWESIDKGEYTHPVILIDIVVTFFKLLK